MHTRTFNGAEEASNNLKTITTKQTKNGNKQTRKEKLKTPQAQQQQ